MLLLGIVFAELRFRQAAAPYSPGIGGWVGPMRVLLSLLLSKLRLGHERLGWESAGWSPQPLAGLRKSPGQLEQSPGEFWSLLPSCRSPRAEFWSLRSGCNCG